MTCLKRIDFTVTNLLSIRFKNYTMELSCNWESVESLFRMLSPKSGDITRCVNVVDNLGFPPVRLDNQQRFVDMTMI